MAEMSWPDLLAAKDVPEARRLRDALVALKQAFEQVRKPNVITPFDVRDREEAAALLDHPSRDDVPSDVVGAYAGWAMTTVGDAALYRYFLPRITKEAANGAPFVGCDAATIGEKLELAGWTDWTAQEREAVKLFAAAMREAAVVVGASDGSAEESLEWALLEERLKCSAAS